jgi:hypothetical protein
MRRRDAIRSAWRAVLVATALVAAAAASARAEPAPYRYRAPIVIEVAAPFVQMALPPAVYGRVEQDDLRDLRVVDAGGERVPFAVLPPLSTVQLTEQVREADLYPLPARPSAAGVWPSPVDVVVEGERISVRRRGGERTVAAAPRESGGWLIDTGATRRGDPSPRSLRLRWSGPAEFSVAYQLETSADLREWRSGGSGQVMALRSASGTLAQAVVALPDSPGRFVRLVWAHAAQAPALTGATVLVAERQRVAIDSARELSFRPGPEPAGAAASDPRARGALHFDLGGALPLIDVDLRFDAGTHVAPVRLQGRLRADQPWRDLGAAVFYRLERGADVGTSPAIPLSATVRFLRLVPDERAAALAGTGARLVVQASLATIVFANQGRAPFTLLAGSRDAPAAALPVSAVVPQLDAERARFGRAVVGEFGVDEAGERAATAAARTARLRPWLLWGVLVAGVVGLGALVWRLARSAPEETPSARAEAPRNSPTGLSSSTRSQIALTTIRIGAPRMRPIAPHSQPKTSTPTKTAKGLIRLARPVHHGVSRLPTTPWIANELAPMSIAWSMLSNWMKPTIIAPTPTSTAPT